MRRSDVAAVKQLLERAGSALHHPPLGEDQLLALFGESGDGFAGVLCWRGDPPRLAAYAQASRARSDWAVGVVLDPGPGRSGSEPSKRLLAAALEEIAAQGGGRVHLWAPMPTEGDDLVASQLGLERERDLYQMRRRLPLDASSPPVEVRAFVPGKDEEAWLRANNRAFEGHPEQGDWDLATLLKREREPWFDPEGFLLHERDGRIAAFCWTKIHAEETPPVGEIYVIGVDPRFQGLGLGKSLTLAGLATMAARGVRTGSLYVDSANSAALAMYRGLGFSLDHVDRAYTAEVRRASSATTKGPGGAGRLR